MKLSALGLCEVQRGIQIFSGAFLELLLRIAMFTLIGMSKPFRGLSVVLFHRLIEHFLLLPWVQGFDLLSSPSVTSSIPLVLWGTFSSSLDVAWVLDFPNISFACLLSKKINPPFFHRTFCDCS